MKSFRMFTIPCERADRFLRNHAGEERNSWFYRAEHIEGRHEELEPGRKRAPEIEAQPTVNLRGRTEMQETQID